MAALPNPRLLASRHRQRLSSEGIPDSPTLGSTRYSIDDNMMDDSTGELPCAGRGNVVSTPASLSAIQD